MERSERALGRVFWNVTRNRCATAGGSAAKHKMTERCTFTEFIVVLCILIPAYVSWTYPVEHVVQCRTDQLIKELGAMMLRIERLQFALQAQNASCLGSYDQLLEQIDADPKHAVLLKEGKPNIWAVASHEAPEYFTSVFGAFSKRYMSSTCSVYAPVRNDGVNTGKWCP